MECQFLDVARTCIQQVTLAGAVESCEIVRSALRVHVALRCGQLGVAEKRLHGNGICLACQEAPGTVAKAVELSALSLELDRALVEAMGIGSALSMPVYCKAYRRCANRPSREGQIALVVEVGHELDRYVHKPLLRKILSLMRRPARLAGLGALQNFLERGFSSFASMRGADQFLAMIADRETKLLEAIFDGDPGPFPDPLGSKEDSS